MKDWYADDGHAASSPTVFCNLTFSSRLHTMQERGCRDQATEITMARPRVQACGDFESIPLMINKQDMLIDEMAACACGSWGSGMHEITDVVDRDGGGCD